MSSAWYSGIAASILTPLILGFIADRTRDVDAGRDGWRRVRPSGGVYAMIAGLAGFTLLLFYVYFFIGSARADAERQMMYLSVLACTFLAATLWAIWSTFRESVEWQGGNIRVRSLGGPVRMGRLSELASIEYASVQSVFVLRFRDGWVVKVSPYMHGTRQLLQHIDRLAPNAASENFFAPDTDED
jgi:hypothetical protein